MRRILSFVLLFALTLAACGSDQSSSETGALDGDWILDSLIVEGDMAIPLPADPLDFRIDGDTFGGDAGCNSMGGSATFSGDGSLQVGDAFMTEMACLDGSLMDFEQIYLANLTTTTAWSLEDSRLVLTGPTSTLTYVVRVAPPDLPITETTWMLDTFFDTDTAMTSVGMEDVTIQFGDASVRLAGRCWAISGSATVEPGGEGNLRTDFTASDPDFSCDDRAFFSEMMERLARVSEYEITEQRLTLSNAGAPILGFRG